MPTKKKISQVFILVKGDGERFPLEDLQREITRRKSKATKLGYTEFSVFLNNRGDICLEAFRDETDEEQARREAEEAKEAARYQEQVLQDKRRITITRGDLGALLGEGFHTAFRKATDCEEAWPIHQLIDKMPAADWHSGIEFVLDCLPFKEPT